MCLLESTFNCDPQILVAIGFEITCYKVTMNVKLSEARYSFSKESSGVCFDALVSNLK